MADSIEDIMNFVAVNDRLITGGQPSESQLRDAAAAGFQVVINLGLLGQPYSLPDEGALVAALGVSYHHLPVRWDAPKGENVDRFLELMDSHTDQRVLVHCALNYRVSAFVSLYAQVRLGWTAAQAEAHIARLWSPNEIWRAFIETQRRTRGLPSLDAGAC